MMGGDASEMQFRFGEFFVKLFSRAAEMVLTQMFGADQVVQEL